MAFKQEVHASWTIITSQVCPAESLQHPEILKGRSSTHVSKTSKTVSRSGNDHRIGTRLLYNRLYNQRYTVSYVSKKLKTSCKADEDPVKPPLQNILRNSITKIPYND